MSLGKFGLPSSGKASCNSCATQPTMHAGCFSVSVIHQTLTWTTGYRMFNVHTDVNACNCKQGFMDTIRESALNVDSNRKIPCCTRELNLRRRCAGTMLYHLTYIPTPYFYLTVLPWADHIFFFFFNLPLVFECRNAAHLTRFPASHKHPYWPSDPCIVWWSVQCMHSLCCACHNTLHQPTDYRAGWWSDNVSMSGKLSYLWSAG